MQELLGSVCRLVHEDEYDRVRDALDEDSNLVNLSLSATVVLNENVESDDEEEDEEEEDEEDREIAEEGDTLIHVSAHYGRVRILDLLLERGADINATNKYGFTPLILAYRFSHSDVVKA